MRKVILFFLCIPLWLNAAPPIKRVLTDKRPVKPPPGVDSDLFAKITPREFFKNRAAANPACVADLKKAKIDYRTLNKSVEELKTKRKPTTNKDGSEDAALKSANDEIDAKGADLKAARSKMVELIEKCGECVTREVRGWDVKEPKVPGKPKPWYVTDGSCQVPTTDRASLDKVFSNLSSSLSQAKSYPIYAKRGFSNVLEFQIVNVTRKLPAKVPGGEVDASAVPVISTAFDPTTDFFPTNPVNLAIWVRGFGPLAFRYLIEAKHKIAEDSSTFFVDFDSVSDPAVMLSLKFPEDIFDRTASGRRIPVKAQTLPAVQGFWFVNSDGYLRYETEAQFPFPLDNLAEIARTILVDTLVSASERGEWEIL